jgi:hypothetical protein
VPRLMNDPGCLQVVLLLQDHKGDCYLQLVNAGLSNLTGRTTVEVSALL